MSWSSQNQIRDSENLLRVRRSIDKVLLRTYGIQITLRHNAIPTMFAERVFGGGAGLEVSVLVDATFTRPERGNTTVVDVGGKITSFFGSLGDFRLGGKENELIVSRLPLCDVNHEFVEPLGDVLRGTSSGTVRRYGDGKGGTGGMIGITSWPSESVALRRVLGSEW